MTEEIRQGAVYAIDIARLGVLFMRTGSGCLVMPYSARVCRGMDVYQKLVQLELSRAKAEVRVLEQRWDALELMRPRGIHRFLDFFLGDESRIFEVQRRIDYRISLAEEKLVLIRKEEHLISEDLSSRL